MLFLGYLNFAMTQGLIKAKVDPYSPRMFAVPMWKDKQLGSTVKLLKRLMVDGQILADSLPPGVWRAGIKVDDARRVLRQIEISLADTDRDAAAFVKRHVLEATASAAAIEDHMSNSRPNVLVVDVGAGTTDLGFYKFVLPNNGQARIYPYRNGGSALKIAGDRLDQLLINFIRKQGGLDEHSADGQRSMYVIKRDIRDLKQQLFATGSLNIEDVCDATITSTSFLASVEVSAFKEHFKLEVSKLIGQSDSSVGQAPFRRCPFSSRMWVKRKSPSKSRSVGFVRNSSDQPHHLAADEVRILAAGVMKAEDHSSWRQPQSGASERAAIG